MSREIPKKYRGLYNKAIKKRSRKAAIRSFCLECVGYSEKEVLECADSGCPLHKYRGSG